MKQAFNWLRNKRGGNMVSGAVVMLILSGVLALIMSVVPVLDGIATVDRMANEVARYIEVRGDTSTAQSEFHRLKAEYKILDADMHIEANTIGASSRIQLDDEFTVLIDYRASIGIGPLIKLPVSPTRKATGRSEHYWKEE